VTCLGLPAPVSSGATLRGKFGLPVERDRHFVPDRTLVEYAEDALALGRALRGIRDFRRESIAQAACVSASLKLDGRAMYSPEAENNQGSDPVRIEEFDLY
jgi:hypothetical protein